jgi:hypothetical protein
MKFSYVICLISIILFSISFFQPLGVAQPVVSFDDSVTPPDGAVLRNNSFRINATINAPSLAIMNFSWQGINYSLYNDSLVMMYNFDNVFALGETSTFVTELSGKGTDVTCIGTTCPAFTNTGRYGGCYSYIANDFWSSGSFNDYDNYQAGTVMAWLKTNAPIYQTFLMYTDINADDGFIHWALSNAGRPYQQWVAPDGGWSGKESRTIVADGSWHHVAFVADGTNPVRVYIDGIDWGTWPGVGMGNGDESDFIADSRDVGIVDNRVSIGYFHYNVNQRFSYFDGLIDEIRMYNRSLSKDEVNINYYSSLNRYTNNNWTFYKDNVNLRNGNYTFHVYAFDSGGSIAEAQGGNRTVTINDSAAPLLQFTPPTPADDLNTSLNSVSIAATSTDINRGNNYMSSFIDLNGTLVGWWRMDDVSPGNDVAYDYTGKHDAVMNGSGGYTSIGYVGDGYHFEGKGKFQTGTHEDFNITSGSILFWFNSTSTQDQLFNIDIDMQNRISTYIDSDGNFETDAYTGGATIWQFNNIVPINDGSWHHAAVIWDASGTEVYLDGVLAVSESDDNRMNWTSDPGVFIGGYGNLLTLNLTGDMDDVMLFNYPISHAELLAIYINKTDAQVAKDFTGLPYGDYNYTAYAQDREGNVNMTRRRLNLAPCFPKTCPELGRTCGDWNDGCGTMIDCGSCGPGLVCSVYGCIPATPGAPGFDAGLIIMVIASLLASLIPIARIGKQ